MLLMHISVNRPTLFVESFTPSRPFLEKRFFPPVDVCVVVVAGDVVVVVTLVVHVALLVVSSSASLGFLGPELPLDRRRAAAFNRRLAVPSEF